MWKRWKPERQTASVNELECLEDTTVGGASGRAIAVRIFP